MMSIDITELVKELKEYKLEVTRRLEYMVAMVAYDFVVALGDNTPVGSEEALANNKRYRDFYVGRQKQYGIPMEVGYHAGSWQFSPDGNLQFSTMIADVSESANHAFNEAQASYKLGQTFYIGANTPAMVILEGRQARLGEGGIVKPAVDKVMDLYRIKASDYYNTLKG